jgi:hypothetical protein
MKSFPVLVVGAVTVAVLSGCSGGGGTTTPAPVTHAAAVTPAPTVAPAMSVRANHVKTVGSEAGVTDPLNGGVIATFTVTKIVVDPKCTGEGAMPPQNGHYIEIFETAQLAANAGATITGGMSPNFGWTYVDAAGNTSGAGTASMNASTCLPQKDLIENNIPPGDKSTGAFVIDVPATTGTLVYKIVGVDAGWEYQIP